MLWWLNLKPFGFGTSQVQYIILSFSPKPGSALHAELHRISKENGCCKFKPPPPKKTLIRDTDCMSCVITSWLYCIYLPLSGISNSWSSIPTFFKKETTGRTLRRKESSRYCVYEPPGSTTAAHGTRDAYIFGHEVLHRIESDWLSAASCCK